MCIVARNVGGKGRHFGQKLKKNGHFGMSLARARGVVIADPNAL